VPRRITFRVVLFFVLVAAVFVACYYGIRYYANDNWFVTLKGSQLVIYRGQPGGVLWFKPKLVQQTGVTTAHVLPIRVSDLRQSVDESSLAAARRYVNNLQQEYDNRQALEIPSSTSTSVPGIGPTGIGPSGVLPTEPPTTAPPASTVPGGPTSSTVTTTTTAAGASTTTTASTATTTTVPAATVPTAPSTTDTPGPGAGGTT
jgi:hypothetical protein